MRHSALRNRFVSDAIADCLLPFAEDIMKARIKITLKSGVLDPQGKAIQNALGALGFEGVNDVRQGKYIEVDVAGMSEERARAEVERMCRDLLANTVIENYSYELAP
jgi:phosphoribosylformylglycinamidine synthase PurS subunit